MTVTTALVVVVALSLGLGASHLVARRRTATDGLSPQDRRTVAIAVRNGQQVDNPKLRPAAAAMASTMIERLDRLERPSKWRRWMWLLLAVTTVLAGVGLVFDSHTWRHVVTIAMNAVIAAGLWTTPRLTARVAVRARAALAANSG
jgi:hypothetical protein